MSFSNLSVGPPFCDLGWQVAQWGNAHVKILRFECGEMVNPRHVPALFLCGLRCVAANQGLPNVMKM
ncbi:MAG: hypothetical protein ACJASV_000341 [Pseudorhodobacter sp.]